MASGGKMIAQQSYTPPEGSPAYLIEALKDIGIQEWVLDHKTRKKRSNPVVEQFMLKSVGYKANMMTTPWCAYWIGAKLEDAGIPCSKSGMARSYLKWGNKIDHKSDGAWKVGDIVVTWRGRRNDGITGHIFFLLSWDDARVYGLGGNQGDQVSIQAFPRSKIIGIRRARSVTESRIVKATGGATATTTANVVVETAVPDVPAVIPTPPTVPMPPSDHSSGAETALNTIQQADGPLQVLAQMKPWVQLTLAVATIVLTSYVAWRRWKDQKERGI